MSTTTNSVTETATTVASTTRKSTKTTKTGTRTAKTSTKTTKTSAKRASTKTKTTVDTPQESQDAGSNIQVLWTNDLLGRFRHNREAGYGFDTAWQQAEIDRQKAFENVLSKLDKRVDGQLYLVGAMEKNGELLPAARNLKTNNLSLAIRQAVNALSQEDSRLSLYIGDNELVISQYTVRNEDIPSLFSFRCVVTGTNIEGKVADQLVDCTASLGTLVSRVFK